MRAITDCASFRRRTTLAKASPAIVLAVDNTVPGRRTSGGWQGEDRVFFHRSQIKVGTRLIDFGRRNHGDEYVVIDIKTTNSRGKLIPVPEPIKLSDLVVMRKLKHNEPRTVTFQSISYSAVWRLKS